MTQLQLLHRHSAAIYSPPPISVFFHIIAERPFPNESYIHRNIHHIMEPNATQLPFQINTTEPSPEDFFSDPGLPSLFSILGSESPGRFSPNVADKQPSYRGGSNHVSVETPDGLQVAQATSSGPPESLTQSRRAPRRQCKQGMKIQPQKKRGRPRKDGGNAIEPQEEVSFPSRCPSGSRGLIVSNAAAPKADSGGTACVS